MLDTNTVLDWLVFRDAHGAALANAIQARHLQWVACPGMRDELSRTLGSRALAKWHPDGERALAAFDAWAVMCSAPSSAPRDLRCSDVSDQMFLDLALARGARWLVTRDKALLRVARRARTHGLQIVRPTDSRLKQALDPSTRPAPAAEPILATT